ncbi:hypothetical protein F5Y15DRAFT_15823 [Xylariaceae sp. FL0016]|nr:hypothetical protein F5Y15DRAFT_15823 [Xylariaceae sp. FL0016]
MAGLFQSLWSSNISKRLLRYCLTKLDYFDTEALDLDKFDFGSGNITWQNVAIKIEKLEQLLQLPPSIEIQSAKVLVLRAHLPSSIYSSPILVEADGIEIKVKIASQDVTRTKRKESMRRASSLATEADPVPHAIDLAQSFLETQPLKEKAELQAALDAKKQDLTASIAISEDGSEDDYALGTGQALTLPTFLASYIDGIIDRLQLSIKGLTCQVDVEVPIETNSPMKELVTFQLAIDEVDAEDVRLETSLETNEEGATTEMQSHTEYQSGRRHIAFRKIRACLISEANVFSNLSRSPSMPSSAACSSPVMAHRQPMSQETTAVTATPPLPGAHLAESTDLSESQYQPMMDSEEAFNIPYDMGDVGEESFEEELKSTPSTPRALAPQTPALNAARAMRSMNTANSAIQAPRDSWADPIGPTAESEHLLEKFGRSGSDTIESSRSRADSPPLLDEPSPAPSEDLAQSHLFSHEEAESMYMSAFSHADLAQPQAMPGAWGSDSSSPGNSPSSTEKLNSQLPSGMATRPNVQEQVAVENESTAQDTSMNNVEGATHLQDNPLHDDSMHSNNSGYTEHGIVTDRGPPDEATTPRGPTRLVKELISIGSISLYLPSEHHEMVPAPNNPLGRSLGPDIPGAFSVYDGPRSTSFVAADQSPKTLETPIQKLMKVIISPMEVNIDLATGFLLSMVMSRLLAALKEPAQQPCTRTDSRSNSSSDSVPNVQISAEEISINFLEAMSAVADTPERLFNTGPPAFGTEVLLTTSLKCLNIGIVKSPPSTVTSVDLKKFKLGYGNDDIVSFDERIQMRASVRDAFPVTGSDISLVIEKSPEFTRCDLRSLPLHVKIDLQRLEETFSWFGGLSSFLNMSSSMTSNTSPPPRASAVSRKPRSVRFEAPTRPVDVSGNLENKTNVRVGGLRLDLIGKDCSVSVDTSAVKLVTRDEGVGIGISKIQIAGPYLRGSMADPSINAVIANTRIQYLPTPKDNDLERLLELIIPSKHKFDQHDDEIMVDTLLRQRRKGAVLRVNVDSFEVSVARIQQLQALPALGEEVARLSTVAKYLPEDDRPGLLTLTLARRVDVTVDVGGKFGVVQTSLTDVEIGQITVPSLVALGVGTISAQRNHAEELISSVIPASEKVTHGSVLTLRVIGDDMEPVVKLRMRHLNIEYRVPTVMDILGLSEDATPQDYDAALAASVANLGEHAHTAITGKQSNSGRFSDGSKQKGGKATKVDIMFRDCLLGLNPLGLASKMTIVLTDAQLEVALSNGDDAKALGHVNKASVLLIDDVAMLDSKEPPVTARHRAYSNTSTAQVLEMCAQGYVDICYVSSAKVRIQVGSNPDGDMKWLDVELRDDLLVLETCADSTQTLIALANALAPPTPPSKEIKYRTKVVPVQDLLASISADAFGQSEGDYDFDNDFTLAAELGIDDNESLALVGSGNSSPLAVDSQFYDDPSIENELLNSTDSVVSERTTAQDTSDGVLLTNFSSQPSELDDEDLVIHENYFGSGSGSVAQDTAHRWSSSKNTYDQSDSTQIRRNPISVRVRDVHFIWNLFDGYDWNHTRDVISKAVYDIETTAAERQSRQDRGRASNEMDITEEETVIGDFLFNSIYIGIPANRDPRELAQAINHELNDNATETESIATTAMTATPSRQTGAHRTKKKLKLNRSRRHKITFELKGINVDLTTFPPNSGETQSSIDVRVKDLDIFDHVPTSTWKKFATYDQDAGEREMGTSMLHLEILNVKPVPELAAAEIVLKATVLPLRLHVDQDALDFITRFFEFKNDSAPTHSSPSDIPFVQRAEVNSIPVKLDFKPKRVDYAGLRSGHTTEFMNFLVLDEARMVLRHTIIYGVSGFDRLGQTLNDIWMPDVKRNQLPGVLAGLAPVRSLVNVGSGFKDLIEIPIKEYRKDGRIVRSIGKGAAAFAKTTGTEIVKLGAKLAVGTQHALQGAEGVLVKPESREPVGWEEESIEDNEETKQISLYADQPTGVVQGLRGAYSSLARDLNVARDAIIAVPGAVMDSQSAQGAAKAVLKRAPTIIFRPLIGSSKAIGQTLMGATNSLDPQNRRRMDEVRPCDMS